MVHKASSPSLYRFNNLLDGIFTTEFYYIVIRSLHIIAAVGMLASFGQFA